MNKQTFKKLFEAGELQDQYAEYIMENAPGDRVICNGDTLITAMEDGYLAEQFEDAFLSKSISTKLFAVTSLGGETGDIFYGTITQFQDCFCGNEITSFEDLEFHAKGIFGDDVLVNEIEQ